MAKTCAEMIARVKVITGRSNTTSTIDVGEIILDGLNEAQINIVRRTPGIMELQTKDVSTLAVTDQYQYDISSLGAAHIRSVHHLYTGSETSGRPQVQLETLPFDRRYPSPEDNTAAKPRFWTRRDKTYIDFERPFSSEFNGDKIRIDYTAWATPFASVASVATSEIEDADKGLMHYAAYETLMALSKGSASMIARAGMEKQLFEAWLVEFGNYHAISQTGDMQYG